MTGLKDIKVENISLLFLFNAHFPTPILPYLDTTRGARYLLIFKVNILCSTGVEMGLNFLVEGWEGWEVVDQVKERAHLESG